MHRWILGLALVVTLFGANLLTTPGAAEANHVALCQINNSGPLLPVPVGPVLAAVAGGVTAGGGSIACISSNCFHPGALPYSPFRPNC